MTPPEEIRETSRRDIILAAAAELFRRQGYNATSMRQIARAAGYGKVVAGLYNHFDNKEAIFAALLERRAPYDELLPALEAVEGDTAEVFLRNILRAIVPVMSSRLDYLQLVLIDVQEFEGHTIVGLLQNLLPGFVAFMHRLLAFPEVRGDLSPAIMMRTIVSVTVGYLFTETMARTTLIDNLPFPPVLGEAWLDGLVSILIHGIIVDSEVQP